MGGYISISVKELFDEVSDKVLVEELSHRIHYEAENEKGKILKMLKDKIDFEPVPPPALSISLAEQYKREWFEKIVHDMSLANLEKMYDEFAKRNGLRRIY